jgi:hypothetical protein
MLYANSKQTKAGRAILIPNSVNIKVRSISINKKRNFIMNKELEAKTILNLRVLNTLTSKYLEQKLTELKL